MATAGLAEAYAPRFRRMMATAGLAEAYAPRFRRILKQRRWLGNPTGVFGSLVPLWQEAF